MSAIPKGQSQYFSDVFEGIDLSGRVLDDSEFQDCRFLRSTLAETVLRACRFVDCTFEDCDLGLLQVPDTVFTGVRILSSKAIGIDWTRAAWPRVPVKKPLHLEGSAVNFSTFLGLSLPGLVIRDGVARETDFREADLSRADFGGTDLTGALFNATNLSAADFSGARNYVIVPGENRLTGAKFSLPEAMALLHSMDIEIV